MGTFGTGLTTKYTNTPLIPDKKNQLESFSKSLATNKNFGIFCPETRTPHANGNTLGLSQPIYII